MATLSLTDGTNTVTLSGDGTNILHASYIPTPGNPGETVLEGAVVVCEGTASELQTVVRSINQLFALARRLQGTGRADRVYVQYQNEGDASAWRAEIVDGQLAWSDNWMRRQFHASNDTPVELTLSWERVAEWEGPETALTWGSGSASRTITSGDSGSFYNAAEVEDDTIVGELPAPVILNIENNTGGSLNWRNFYITNDGANGFEDDEHQLSVAAAKTITPGENHTTLLWARSVGATEIAKCAGDYFHILAAFTSSSTGIYYRASIYHLISSTYQLLAAGPEVYNTVAATAMELLDLGALPIPPGGEGSADEAIRIVITARSTAGGTATLDFLQMLRAEDYSTVNQIGYSIADEGSITLDEVDQRYYAAERYNILNKRGAPLMVYPGQTNRFVVTFDESSGQYVSNRSIIVSGSYRPRRLTV